MSVLPWGVAIFDPAGINATRTTVSVMVLQSEGMHDTAIITLRGESLSAPELQPGTPVMLTYGYKPSDLETFYGYIDHTAPHYDRSIPDNSEYEDIVCLGESWVMKDPYVGAWSSVKASALVGQIVAKYQLASLIENDDYTWPQLACQGDSAWSFLISLAKKLGYSLSCNKNLVRFVSITAAMTQHWGTMPVFKSRNAAPLTSQQGITRFQSVNGESLNLPGHTKSARSINGLDINTGQVVGAYDDGTSMSTLGTTRRYPFFMQQISDTVVNSQGSAVATLAGMTERNRFQYQACATLTGLTSVKQGMPIVLLGLDNNESGVWWVQEVKHKIKTTGYSMDVSLGRDSLGDSGLRPTGANAVAYSASNPFAYAIHSAPNSVLIRGRWRSASQYNVYVTGGR